MPSTYSSNLKIELIADGEQDGTWGDTTNVNLGTALEEAITGTGSVTFASADVTLAFASSNASQTFRNIRLVLTGTTGGARNLIVPNIEKLYFITNQTADTVTVKTTAGTGVAVPSNARSIVYADGINVVETLNHLNSLSVTSLTATSPAFSGTPTAPTASPGTNTTQIATTAFTAAAVTAATGSLGTMSTQNANSVAITGGSISGITDLAVADGGTGASSITANSVILGNGSSALSGNLVAPGTSGNVLTSNGTTWTSASAKVDQIVVSSTTSPISVGGTVIPLDNTVPQSTEGTEVLTVTITPKSATSTLIINCSFGVVSPSDGRTFTIALFQDSGANAIHAQTFVVGAGQNIGAFMMFTKTSGTTSATTFKVRLGPNVAVSAYVNANSSGTGFFGGVCNTTLTVTEIVT